MITFNLSAIDPLQSRGFFRNSKNVLKFPIRVTSIFQGFPIRITFIFQCFPARSIDWVLTYIFQIKGLIF
jgi:hypothetical protein